MDELMIKVLLVWMKDLYEFFFEKEVLWDWYEFGRGVIVRDVVERFGWSIGVVEEELEMVEEKGVFCWEEGIEGLKFWENFIDMGEGKGYKDEVMLKVELMFKMLRESGFI